MIRTDPCGGPRNLPARRVLEPPDFLRRQFSPFSGFQAGIPEGADRDAPQPNDRMANRLAHPPDFTIAAFVNRDDHRRFGGPAIVRGQLHAGARRAPAVDHDSAR